MGTDAHTGAPWVDWGHAATAQGLPAAGARAWDRSLPGAFRSWTSILQTREAINLCRLNYSVGDTLLGQLQQTHTPPLLPRTWGTQTDKSGTKRGRAKGSPNWGQEGQTAARRGPRCSAGTRGGGLSGPPCLISEDPKIRAHVNIHTHALTVRGIFSLPLPPLIKNYKCLIKS